MKFLKIISLLLLIISFQGITGNCFTEKLLGEEKHALAHSADYHSELGTPQFPCTPVAELTNLQSHPMSVSRIQRVQLGEYFASMKNLLQCCAYHESSLLQHKRRMYNTTAACHCRPSSEYYVFTLRHIII